MTKEQADRIETKLDDLLELLKPVPPTVEALGTVLVRRGRMNDLMGYDKNTLSQNEKVDKFEEIGSVKTFVEIGAVTVVKQRKRRDKRPG